jgi:hypothetical protein
VTPGSSSGRCPTAARRLITYGEIGIRTRYAYYPIS